MPQQSIVWNKETKRYHFVKINDDGNIIFDYGALSDPQAITGTDKYISDGDLGGDLVNDIQSNTVRFGIDLGAEPFYDLNPSYSPNNVIQKAALLRGGTTGAHLEAPHSTDWEFNASAQFSIFFWRNPYWAQISALYGLDMTYCSLATVGTSNANVMAITSGGSSTTDRGNAIRLWLFTASNGSTVATISTPFSGGAGPAYTCGRPWTFGAVTYNGGEAVSTDRAHLYQNAEDVGVANYANASGTLPASVLQGTASVFKLGKIGGSYNHYGNHAMFNVAVFKARVLTANEITTLYNNGVPMSYAELVDSGFDLTGLVAFWNCDEESGTRFDSSGNDNHLIETNGTVECAKLVKNITDGGRTKSVMMPICNKNLDFQGNADDGRKKNTLEMGCAPYLEATGLNNKPCLYFPGQHYLHVNTPSALETATLDYFSVIQRTGTFLGETFEFSLGGIESTDKYYIFGLTNAGRTTSTNVVNWVRIRNPDNSSMPAGAASTGSSINGLMTIAADTNYAVAFRINGTRHELYVNGTQQTVEEGNASYPEYLTYGPNVVYPRNNIGIMTLSRSDGTSFGGSAYRIGRILAVPRQSTANFNALNDEFTKLAIG